MEKQVNGLSRIVRIFKLGQMNHHTTVSPMVSDPFDQSLKQAVAFHQAGRLPEAESLYHSIIQLQPDHADANFNFGLLALQTKRFAVCIFHFKRALEADPGLEQYWVGYIEALMQVGQIATARRVLELGLQQGLKGEAFDALRARLKSVQNAGASSDTGFHPGVNDLLLPVLPIFSDDKPDPQDIDLLLKLFNEGQYAQAETQALTMVERFPSYGLGWKILGLAYKQLQKLEDALASMQKAVALWPGDAGAHNNLGVLFKELGRLDEAEACYLRALDIKSDYGVALSNLGDILNELGRFDEAEVRLRQALEIKPDDVAALNNLGKTLKEQGLFDEAETVYRRALKFDPDYAEAHSNLGVILRNLGRLDEAEKCYRRTLEMRPDSVEAHRSLGNILLERGLGDEAEESYKRMLAIKSDDSGSVAAPPVTVLLPLGRSGSLFFHSLFDGHPEVSTLPGVYFKGWFGLDVWKIFKPDFNRQDWREHLLETILDRYQPLFDARSQKNVIGKPLSDSDWLAKDSGFMEMGADRSQCLILDQDAFSKVFLSLLAPLSFVGQKECFELIHQAFDIAIRGHAADGAHQNKHIFYHIHNPDRYSLFHFMRHYPQARILYIVRNPVQSLESWMFGGVQWEADDLSSNDKVDRNALMSSWNASLNKVLEMITGMTSSLHRSIYCRGVRLEDVKRNPKHTMAQIAAWMEISDHPSLYQACFCGLQYWGPASSATGNITGFDTKAIDRPVGRFLGARDVKIFETLFWPFSRLYGYTELDFSGFKAQLAEVRPWLDEPLEFEIKFYERLADPRCELKKLPSYLRLHGFLRQLWSVLDRDGTYQGMVQPLPLSG